jgi:glutamate-ammonia-ligase adenylyltransferase
MSATAIDSRLAGSPFLTGLATRFPHCLEGEPQAAIDEIIETLAITLAGQPDLADLKKAVRDARSQAALIIALADIKGLWPLEQVTENLTNVADACLVGAVNWLLRDGENRGRLQGLSAENPAEKSGYSVLAMGKHGGHELNFSSDIDLVVLYDAERTTFAQGVEPSVFFVRMTKQLVSIMQDMTADGYAYRVDLRLRPDPRATQVALSVEAALVYYESMGQNWERAAMIKARPVAGDIELGAAFLKELRPFIWRKYLDFAAIAEVHSLKKQIHAVKGHGEIAVLGHNVKLGRGGIREIEFFVQTQQLIAGGRDENLRGISTIKMLDQLVKASWVKRQTADDLQQAYRFLRQIEHRIQMIADQQTHQLPASSEGFAAFAAFAGYSDPEILTTRLLETFQLVQKNYDELFQDNESTSVTGLVFTGQEDDDETLGQLSAQGFSQPEMVSATIKGWYAGRYRAMRTETACERLTDILPTLLAALSASGDPDATFIAFDRFLSGLPAGIQLFSLLRANPQYLELIANILGAAPRLAAELSRRPKILDAVLEPSFFSSLPEKSEIEQIVQVAMPSGLAFDEVLDQARIVGREQMFRIGVRILSDTIAAPDAASAYSDLAEGLIERLLGAVKEEMENRHGVVDGGKIAIVAMGKLGGREMTAASDLDLIVIYDHDENASASSGPKQISISQYYARLTQRLITAITAPTPEGVLYEVDMRLRPSGNKGPIATHISAFLDYQQNSAWTWEKLALTRARVVAGNVGFSKNVQKAITHSLCQSRDEALVRADAAAMRQTMLEAKKPANIWDIKNISGGMVDLEFIIQVLQIIHAHDHPEILSPNMLKAISNLNTAGLLDSNRANQLENTCLLYQQLAQVLKLGVTGAFDPQSAPLGLTRLITVTTASPDIAVSQEVLKETQQTIRQIFVELVADRQEG